METNFPVNSLRQTPTTLPMLNRKLFPWRNPSMTNNNINCNISCKIFPGRSNINHRDSLGTLWPSCPLKIPAPSAPDNSN